MHGLHLHVDRPHGHLAALRTLTGNGSVGSAAAAAASSVSAREEIAPGRSAIQDVAQRRVLEAEATQRASAIATARADLASGRLLTPSAAAEAAAGLTAEATFE